MYRRAPVGSCEWDKFHPGYLLLWSQSSKMLSECVKIYRIPDTIGPSLLLLDILTKMISVYVKADAVVVLTCHSFAIYRDGTPLIRLVRHRASWFQSTRFPILSGQSVGLDVQTRSKRQRAFRVPFILVSFDPMNADQRAEIMATCRNDRSQISVVRHFCPVGCTHGETLHSGNGGLAIAVPVETRAVTKSPEI